MCRFLSRAETYIQSALESLSGLVHSYPCSRIYAEFAYLHILTSNLPFCEQDDCARTKWCSYFTYNPSNNQCTGYDTCETTSSEVCPTCVSSHVDCAAAPWIMAVGGTRWHRQDTADLISLDPARHPVPSCLRSAEPYPYTVDSASGGMAGGTLN